MADRDLLTPASGILDGYGVLRVDLATCPQALADDLQAILQARWFAKIVREDFETAFGGARIYGPIGTFDGVVTDSPMPVYWRDSGAKVASQTLWEPDGRHPIGRWLADVGKRLLALPPPELLEAVIRRHGIEGNKEPAPQMLQIDESSIAILLHRPKAKQTLPIGVKRVDSLLSRWDPIRHVAA